MCSVQNVQDLFALDLQKDLRQFFDEICRQHTMLRKRFGAKVTRRTVNTHGGICRFKRLHILRAQRTRDAGQNIAAAALCHAGVARCVHTRFTARRCDNCARTL